MTNNAYTRKNFVDKYIKISTSNGVNKKKLESQVNYAINSAREKILIMSNKYPKKIILN